MIREIVKIDEELCNGCGECVPNCHEGALQIIDGKARLISDLMCDGLGACIGHCPMDAITIEKREAGAYDERKVMAIMVEKGENTVVAHLEHLLDHNENEFYAQAIAYLTEHEERLPFSLHSVTERVERLTQPVLQNQTATVQAAPLACGCPGTAEQSFTPAAVRRNGNENGNGYENGNGNPDYTEAPSQLSQWPVQMHLINPGASFFREADVVLAADCVAYSLGNFHHKYLKEKSLAIACPKLDHGPEQYIEKIRQLIDDARINTLHIMLMEVPCCSGLRKMVEIAQSQANRKIPVKQTIVGLRGEIFSEEWIY